MSEEFCEVEVSRINRPKVNVSNIDPAILAMVNKMNLQELPPQIEREHEAILLRCNECKKMKPLHGFYADGSKSAAKHRHGKNYQCKVCSDRHRIEYSKTPEGKVGVRKSHLKRKYGINQSEYEEMLAAQGGKCAICSSTEPGGQWNMFHVDHCHLTGRIRGLLCNNCNTGIGLLKHNPFFLRIAASYLEKHVAASSPPAS